MKLLKTIIKGLPLYEGDLEIDLTAAQRVTSSSRERLNPITNTLYTNPVIEFSGLNASGKTMTLRILKFSFLLLNGKNLNQISNTLRDLVLEMTASSPIEIISYYFWNQDFYVLRTVITKTAQSGVLDRVPSLRILSEKLFKKKDNIKPSKNNWRCIPEDIDDRNSFYTLIRNRDTEETTYLADDVSINILNVKKGAFLKYFDFLETVNFNFLNVLGDYFPEVIHFLDPNIEYFKMDRLPESKTNRWLLKFKGKKEIILYDYDDINRYLSSGTIKGIGLFMMAIASFYEGGYILVDELENHFNIQIMKCLLEFFLNRQTNKKGATLLFSTHYPEILDFPNRNDSIYILANNGKIECKNLAELKPRNDGMKASQAFIQNLLNTTTAPSYDNYIALKRMIVCSDFQANIRERNT